jgi:predicted phage tail protein
MNTDDDHCDDNDNDGDSGSMDHDTEVVVAIEFRGDDFVGSAVVAEYMNRIQQSSVDIKVEEIISSLSHLKDEICARISQQLENNDFNVIPVKEFSANDLRAMPPLFIIERLFVALLQQSFVQIKNAVKIDY